ncbi:MAG: thiamine ABC transporter substrate-binding protein [Deltaproteobacteria bacterium]|nr:thiamine ABC transporter substrate-binding protein [Deltaproteobacteria bacterium]|tara:strand:+ start:2893 stop:3906 length:1014 start_codon:yes stop_codon:yes gene_type:complete
MNNIILSLIFTSALLIGISINSASARDLTIYTYESFNSEWGPGPVVFKSFEEQCECKIKVVTHGDSGTVLNRSILEKGNPNADILLGLNNSEIEKSFNHKLWIPYRSKLLDQVPKELDLDKKNRVTPFDYGYISFVYDSQKIKNPPRSLEDLLDQKYKRKIVIQNPKTSSPGLSMLHWTIAVFGEDEYLDYWKKLQKNLLSVTDGWSAAYGMFTKGEVPIVLSYVTSPAYHLEYEKTKRYKAALFKEGHYRQIEFAGILKGTEKIKMAQDFIDFMLSEKFQSVIPLTNWMYPVIRHQPLPDSFQIAPEPEVVPELNSSLVYKQNKKWLKAWSRAMSE